MPAYHSAIKVNYGRETVRIEKSRTISGPLSIKKLAALVGDHVFGIRDDDRQFSDKYIINWTETRPETDQERQVRIKKGEIYNANREKFLMENGRKD